MIIPGTRYPGQIESDPTNYPYGKAKNRSGVDVYDGTPWERNLVNDIFGHQQALVTKAGIVPSDTPETAQNSQLLQAQEKLFAPNRNIIVGFGVASHTGGIQGTGVPADLNVIADANFEVNAIAGDQLLVWVGALKIYHAPDLASGAVLAKLTPNADGEDPGPIWVYSLISLNNTDDLESYPFSATFPLLYPVASSGRLKFELCLQGDDVHFAGAKSTGDIWATYMLIRPT